MWILEMRFNLLKCVFKQYHIRMRAVVTLQPCAFHHITPILDDIQYNGITLSVTLLIYNFTLASLQWSKTSKVVLVQSVQASSHCVGQASKNVLTSSLMSCRAGKVAYSYVRPAERVVSDSPQNKWMNREKWFLNYCIMVKNLHSVVLKKKTSNEMWEFFLSPIKTCNIYVFVVPPSSCIDFQSLYKQVSCAHNQGGSSSHPTFIICAQFKWTHRVDRHVLSPLSSKA